MRLAEAAAVDRLRTSASQYERDELFVMPPQGVEVDARKGRRERWISQQTAVKIGHRRRDPRRSSNDCEELRPRGKPGRLICHSESSMAPCRNHHDPASGLVTSRPV
jgi:hypothetical protein